MLKGFRNFLMRGNVVDLAVAVIIGAAFNGVVDGLIKGVIDPLIATLAPGDVKALEVVSAILNFLTKAAVVYFLIVRPFSALVARLAAAPPVPAATPADVQLLGEIRDLLRDRK
jgi:large conductance mechanosensitive channel